MTEINQKGIKEFIQLVLSKTEIPDLTKLDILNELSAFLSLANNKEISNLLVHNAQISISYDALFIFRHGFSILFDKHIGVVIMVKKDGLDIIECNITDFTTTELKDNYLGCFIEYASNLITEHSKYNIY